MRAKRQLFYSMLSLAFVIFTVLGINIISPNSVTEDRFDTLVDSNQDWMERDQRNPNVRRSKDIFRRGYLAGTNNQRAFYEKYIELIGFNGIADVLEESYCHSQGHELGKIIFRRFRTLEESIHLVRDRCTSGILHGALMEAFNTGYDHVSRVRVSDEINNICGQTTLKSIQNTGSCVHGIGHALMSLSGYKIPSALEACNRLETRPLQYFCSTGAFMEYMIEKGDDDIQQSLHFPCDVIDEFYAACYRYKMGFTIDRMQKEGHSISGIAQECMGLKNMPRLGCFHGLGFGFLRSISETPSKITFICGFGNLDDRRICIEGAIEKLADLDQKTAFDVCQHLDDKEGRICFEAANEKMYRSSKDYSLYFL